MKRFDILIISALFVASCNNVEVRRIATDYEIDQIIDEECEAFRQTQSYDDMQIITDRLQSYLRLYPDYRPQSARTEYCLNAMDVAYNR
jgi:hypothetical protein